MFSDCLHRMFWTLISSVILFPWSKLVVALLTLSYPDVCNHIDFFQRASLDAWLIKSTPWSSTTIAWSERRRLNGHVMRYWYTRIEHCLRLEIRITEDSSWVLDIAHLGKIMRLWGYVVSISLKVSNSLNITLELNATIIGQWKQSTRLLPVHTIR